MDSSLEAVCSLQCVITDEKAKLSRGPFCFPDLHEGRNASQSAKMKTKQKNVCSNLSLEHQIWYRQKVYDTYAR